MTATLHYRVGAARLVRVADDPTPEDFAASRQVTDDEAESFVRGDLALNEVTGDLTVPVAAQLRGDGEAHVAALLQALAELQAVADRANATINQSPAATIKEIARANMTTTRRVVRVVRLMFGVTDSTEGT